jgi:hypothetical protein
MNNRLHASSRSIHQEYDTRPDIRRQAAAEWLESWLKIDRLTDHRLRPGFAIQAAFLAGYEHAMQQGYEELLHENYSLHARLMDHDEVAGILGHPARFIPLSAVEMAVELACHDSDPPCECEVCATLRELLRDVTAIT